MNNQFEPFQSPRRVSRRAGRAAKRVRAPQAQRFFVEGLESRELLSTAPLPQSHAHAAVHRDVSITPGFTFNAPLIMALSISNPQPRLNQPVTFTALLLPDPGQPQPTGFVTFKIDNQLVVPAPIELVNGVSQAMVTISTLSLGSHFVQASFPGDQNYAPSLTPTRFVTVNPPPLVAPDVTLTVSPNPVITGQPVTLHALVTPHGLLEAGVAAEGPAPFGGTVTFTINGQPFGPLNLVGEPPFSAGATLTFNAPPPGTYTIQANYSGDANLAPASSSTMQLVVNPVPGDGPVVTHVARLGFHTQPTSLVLTFNEPLDPARAQDLNNYQLVQLIPAGHHQFRFGRPIGISSVDYTPGGTTLTIHPSELLGLRQVYQLTVHGQPPTGLTDTQGRFLDGANNGLPGSNFNAIIDRHTLAGPAQVASRRSDRGAI